MAEDNKPKRKHIKVEIGSEHASSYFYSLSYPHGHMVDDEYLHDLKFPNGATTYDKMRSKMR